MEEEEGVDSTVVEVVDWCHTGACATCLNTDCQIVILSDCLQTDYQEHVEDVILSLRYGYAVQDDEGNDFNQQEQSDGEQVSRK